jgi:hypothetical protein
MVAAPGAPAARRVPWEVLSSVVAVLVGACALGVSWYTARLQRTQIEAQIWPTLTFQFGDAVRGLGVTNKGTGPALVGWTRILVDGKVQPGWDAALTALQPRHWSYSSTGIDTAVLSAGETAGLLRFDGSEDYAAFNANAPRLAFQACFCSLLKACEVATFSAPQALNNNNPPAPACKPR